ncbi:MAG: hypothetical protein BJ554DRAFT_1589, partial [Olpidium bornovanus]
HVTIQQLTSLTEAPDANQKDFFQGKRAASKLTTVDAHVHRLNSSPRMSTGLNDAAGADGTLFVDVPAGTLNTAGTYRICSMSGSFSHQPTVMPIAQRGAQDDCIRVNVGDNNGSGNDAGDAGGNNGGNNAGNDAENGAENDAGTGAENDPGTGAENDAGTGAENDAGTGAGNNAGNGAENNRGGGRFGGIIGAGGRGRGGRGRA